MAQFYYLYISTMTLDSWSKVAILLILAILGAHCGTTQCENEFYIIPPTFLDSIFDTTLSQIRSENNLLALIQNPNEQNVKDYLIAMVPGVAPLIAFAALMLLTFLIFVIQILCFSCCGQESCGNQLHSETYRPEGVRCLYISFLVFSGILFTVTIGSLIVSVDLSNAATFTGCNANNILVEAYEGNDNQVGQPWSGLNNFADNVNHLDVQLHNTAAFLSQYFSSSNSDYTAVTSDATGSLYANSQIFQCQISSVALECPYPDINGSSSSVCPSPLEAVFNQQFCDPSVTNSAKSLVNEQMSVNSTAWRNNIMNIADQLNTINGNINGINSVSNDVDSFTSGVTDYESILVNGFQVSDNVLNNTSIGLYVFFSFILVVSLTGFIGACCVFNCDRYGCKAIFHFLWVFYFLFGLLVFVASAFILALSLSSFDVCTAYDYYFTSEKNFNSLGLTSDASNVLQTCFFTNSETIFTVFNDNNAVIALQQLADEYTKVVPSGNFYTVVTTIENTLSGYASNPQTVKFVAQTDSNSPINALNEANTFANFSAPNSDQSCDITKDFLVYDPIQCFPYTINNPIGDNNCVVMLNSYDINTKISERETKFNDKGTTTCQDQGQMYKDNVDALMKYGASVSDMALSLFSVDVNPSNPLQAYEENYQTYYVAISNFMNADVQQQFNSFLNPYAVLTSGSSCSFVTKSLNGIVGITCNQLFPYIHAFSALNITIASMMLLLMVFSYFLTTRATFYEYLEGDLQNYGVQMGKDIEELAYEMDTKAAEQLLNSADRDQI